MIPNYYWGSVVQLNLDSTQTIVKSGLSNITDVVKDDNGNIYVTQSPDKVLKIDKNGTVSILAEGLPLNLLLGLTIDDSGNLLVANFRDAKIHHLYIPQPLR